MLNYEKLSDELTAQIQSDRERNALLNVSFDETNVIRGDNERDKDNFIAAVRKFMEMDKLTALLLKELIERIEVCHIEGVGKNLTQHFKSTISSSDVLRCPKFKNQDL